MAAGLPPEQWPPEKEVEPAPTPSLSGEGRPAVTSESVEAWAENKFVDEAHDPLREVNFGNLPWKLLRKHAKAQGINTLHMKREDVLTALRKLDVE